MLVGHSQRLSAALQLIQRMRPPYWKIIGNDAPDDLAALSECVRLGVEMVIRLNTDNGHWLRRISEAGPEQAAAEYVAEYQRQPWYYATAAGFTETLNEPFPFWELTSSYVAFEAECVRLFAADGRRTIVNNFGAMQEGHHVPGALYYGHHRYKSRKPGWPDAQGNAPLVFPWWRSILQQQPDAKLFITEVGLSDALGTDVPPGRDNDYGWRHSGVDAFWYWQELRWHEEQMKTVPGYAGASFVFQFGGQEEGEGNWRSFECLGSDIEAHMVAQTEPKPSVTDLEKWGRVPPPKERGSNVDKKAVAGALDVIWGWTNPLVGLKADQAVKEIRDAVNIIKREAAIS